MSERSERTIVTAASASGTADRTETAAWSRRGLLLAILLVLLAAALVANLGAGAVAIAPAQVVAILADRVGLDLPVPYTAGQESVLTAIRAPRVVLCGLGGAVLASSGAALQGVFRNPLADPGVIGVSSGAAVGAVGAIVTGLAPFGGATTAVAAFLCGLGAALLGYAVARHEGRTEVLTLVLTGVAISAIGGAVVGLLTYLADDAALRTIVFWTMGSFGGATWPSVLSAAPLLLAACVALPWFGRALNALVLGEREARHLGVHPERVRLGVLALAALGTGACVALCGLVGFVGLVVPHLIRLVAGPDHRLLVPASALGGAALLLAADLFARTAVAPAELPVGVVTALAGGPFFLFLLVRTRQRHGGWA